MDAGCMCQNATCTFGRVISIKCIVTGCNFQDNSVCSTELKEAVPFVLSSTGREGLITLREQQLDRPARSEAIYCEHCWFCSVSHNVSGALF